MTNASYGYKTYKAHHFVAELRDADGCSMMDIATAGSRQQCFQQIAGRNKGCKITKFWQVEATDTESLEQYGFTPARTYPSRRSLFALDND